MKEDKYLLSSSSSSVLAAAVPRRRGTLGESRQANGMGFSRQQPILSVHASSSSDSNSSPDDSIILDDYSDLSELSTSTTLDARDNRSGGNEEAGILDQEKEDPHLEIRKNSISVVMHLELVDASCFGLLTDYDGNSSDSKVALEWRCKEPAEIGRPPMFELKVSNGWEAEYDPASGVLTAMTPGGDPLRYEIPGVSGNRSSSTLASTSARTSTARFTQRAYLPPLVRFCQCLALRTMQLRRIAQRGQASKLPFVHYDTFPESLLASFRYRSSLLTNFPQALSLSNRSASNEGTEAHGEGNQNGVEIAGIGRGYIDATGDLRVVYLDGSQLTLAASGLQLRFRPSWSSDDESPSEDVFELLTTSSMSAFLPSIVKQKLESVPEFIRRLKAIQ
ncbi:unnamed protein product [Phytophthora fragariaefolia]|uniref:Unnamed protein product n=1 Tax=Phytophthora fragariaefolia TaxID=1490495 RepID=A0A9W6XCQ3_9STRA|nr:unnamed protein product [Phytophthora fragariaefolia]